MSRLKDLRLSRGYTQGKMARELGTSQQTISRIEFKDEMVPTDILIKASKYFNVSADYLLGLTEEKYNKVCADRLSKYVAEYEEVLMDYAALEPEYQEVVKSVVKTLMDVQGKRSDEN